MSGKRYQPEEIISKLREAEVYRIISAVCDDIGRFQPVDQRLSIDDVSLQTNPQHEPDCLHR